MHKTDVLPNFTPSTSVWEVNYFRQNGLETPNRFFWKLKGSKTD